MHTHAHPSSDHSGAGRARAAAPRGQRELAVVLMLTSASMFAEVLGGLATGSLALLADAGHMLTDVLALALALVALRVAQRPPTPARTYGFWRAEVLAALTNSLILLVVSASILYQAAWRIWAPEPVDSLPMMLIAGVGLVVNLIGINVLHTGATENLNLEGARLEIMADLLSSLGVIVTAVAITLTGWWALDLLTSIGIGLFILPRAWRLLWAALDVLLEAAPPHINRVALEQALGAVPGVAAIHDLHVWTITSGFVALSAHVTAQERQPADVLHDLQVLLRTRFGIQHATLQVESVDHADDACCRLDPRCVIPDHQAPRAFVPSSEHSA